MYLCKESRSIIFKGFFKALSFHWGNGQIPTDSSFVARLEELHLAFGLVFDFVLWDTK